MAASVGCSSRDHSEWRNRIPTTKTSGSRPSGLFRRASRWLRSMDIASLALRAPIRSSRPKVWAHCVKCVWQSHNPGITQRPSASMMGAVPPVAVAEIREPAGVIAAIAPPLIAMSTRRALPGNRALVIIVIIACTCHPASDQKAMGACGRNIVHIRSRLGCLASYTNPLHRTPPLIVWRHLRRHV